MGVACKFYINDCVPSCSIHEIRRGCPFDPVLIGGIVDIIRVVPSAEEALEPFLVGLVVVVHVGAAARAARDLSSRPFHVFQGLVDWADEAAHGCAISIVQGQRAGQVAVGELHAGWVVLRVLDVGLEELLPLIVVAGLFLGLSGRRLTWL